MTTPRGIQRLAFAVAAILAAFVVALASLSWLIDREAVRDAVREQVRAATGLDLQVKGETTLSMFPTSSVVFTDVGVTGADTPATGGAPALRVDELVARLKLLPLFLGRYEVADLALERPQITITRDASGGSNWASLMSTLSQTTSSGSPNALSFSEILIHDGVLIYRDDSRSTLETLTELDMSLAWPAISRSFTATGQATWRSQRLDTSISLADFAATLSGKRSGLKVRIAGAPLKLAFDGTMANGNSLALDGTLMADTASLRQALQWSGQDVDGNSGLGRFSLKGTASIAGSTVAITNANIELDGNTAEGVLSYSNEGHQAIQTTLDAGAIDFTPYVASLRLLEEGTREWERQPFDLRWLNGVDLDMRLSASSITAGSTHLGRTALAANIRDGAMTMSIGEGQMYGGIVKGSFGIAHADDGATVRGQFQFTDVDLETCAGELFGFRKLAGRGNLDLMLDASGSNAYTLAQSLNGTATLTGRDGALLGFNVEQLLRRLERRPLSGAGEFRSGKTPYDKLNIAIRLQNGIATTDDVSIDGPSVRLVLAGATSIPAREFDLKGTASLLPSPGAAPSFELPFVLQGPWDDPLLFPDSDSLIRRSPAAAPLLNAVRSAVERLSGASKAANPSATKPADAPSDETQDPADTSPAQPGADH
jgi:AsmA protein